MGLPQVTSTDSAERVAAASQNVFMQGSMHFSNLSTCDLDGICGDAINRTESSTGDSKIKNISGTSEYADDPFRYGMKAAANVNALKIGMSETMGRSSLGGGRSMQHPASRIVGFESNGVTQRFEGTYSRLKVNETDSSGSLVRKRLLSPLNHASSSEKFCGDSLDIGGSSSQLMAPALTCTAGSAQDHKKANVGPNRLTVPDWFVSRCLESRNFSPFFTDGPLLDKKDQQSSDSSISSPGLDDFSKTSKVRAQSGAISISTAKTISPPLSLSPLGPRFSERMKTAGGYRDQRTDSKDCCSTILNLESLLDKSDKNCKLEHEEDGFKMVSRSFEEVGVLCKEFRPSSMESSAGMFWPFCQESSPTRCAFRSLSGLSVRRSLVGSFEESLLSGRFVSGKPSQKFDGFLAVLSITGGSFSPQSQKLPFSVSSVDGDCFLLYFASIDLGGSSSSKCRIQNARKGLGHDESQTVRSRLRIPMKGRIQLVLSNPEKTPVHTFLCNYDLSDMPAGTKTFQRQKVTLAASVSASLQFKPPEDLNLEVKDKVAPVSSPCMQPIKEEKDTRDAIEEYKMIFTDEIADVNRHQNSGLSESAKMSDLSSRQGSRGFSSHNPGNGYDVRKAIEKECSCENICPKADKKALHSCPKVNENMTGSGALRYALHLRFLCPFHKKGSKSADKCKSVSRQNGLDKEEERRFYLYNDLRVVFPQRQSDSDEGKLKVEYQCPQNPKYFNIGS